MIRSTLIACCLAVVLLATALAPQAAPRRGAGAWMTPDRRAHAEHHAGWGALIGLVPGLVLGAWLAVRCAAADLAAGAMDGLDRRLLALPLVGAVVGAGIGALLGACVGAVRYPRPSHQRAGLPAGNERMRRATLWCCAALVGTPLSLVIAQQPTAQPGERVRVTVTAAAAKSFGAQRWDGVFLHAVADSIYVDPTGQLERLAMPKQDVAKLERSTGTRGNAGTGALIGGGVGLGAGVLLTVLCTAENDESAFLAYGDEVCLGLLLTTIPLGI
ncbi:MAG: hypothetical protein MUC69_07275, partial [Gemmatimonadales bacterium]|nr:hypothetical protein [Gemmatimonadales bacterium]